MNTYNLGSGVTIEVEFKKHTPFVTTDVYFDPDVAKIVVIDPTGSEVLASINLTKSETGKYFHILQTTTIWPVGIYQVKINSEDTNGNTDITINERTFRLE